MNGKSWDKIYQLQDRLLDIIFSIDNSFYLTGGTALHRFYYNLRVSYDLDFFSSSTETFYDEIVNILQKLLDEKIIRIKYYDANYNFNNLVILNPILQLSKVEGISAPPKNCDKLRF